jgi:hypothetical protein
MQREKPAAPRLPRGWKRLGEAVYDPICWRERYVLRSIAVPVASPLDCTWKEFRDALRAMWSLTTACSNWMITQLYTRDSRRTGKAQAKEKLLPMRRVYLYPEARALFPELPSKTVAALEQSVSSRYRARRYEVNWTGAASLASYRYPTPYPVHNQSWSVELENKAPVVSVRLTEKRVRLRLRGGPQFHRQRTSILQIINGQAVRGELAIYRRGSFAAKSSTILVKLVAWLPRNGGKKQERDGTLRVRTDADSLLIAVNQKGDPIWYYHGDHVRRWARAHARQLQRRRDDARTENKPSQYEEKREAATRKYRDRMHTCCHEVSAWLVGYACRRRFAALEYDDTARTFCPEFPYAALRQMIGYKADEAGVEFHLARAAATTAPPESLAEEEGDEVS